MPQKPSDFDQFTQILQRLGVDENFEHIVILCRALQMLLAHGIDGGIRESDSWSVHLDTTERALVYLKSIGKQETSAAGGRSPNPLASVSKQYPLAAALTQPPPLRNKDAYLSLQTFLLTHLLGQEELDSRQVSSIADQIRLAGTGIGKRGLLLNILPETIKDSETYFIELSLALRTSVAVNLYGVGTDFRNAIQRLLDRPVPKIIRPVSTTTLLTKPRSTISGIPAPSNPGRGHVTQLQIPVPGGYPTVITGFIEDDDDDDSTDDEIEADAKQSGYWLSRLQNRTELSWEVLTPLERTRFISALKSGLSEADTKEFIPTVLLSLMYLTGLDLKEVLATACGSQGIFTSDGGYRKEVHQPHQGFVPNDDQTPCMHGKIEFLNLKLPKQVTQVLSEIISLSPKTKSLGSLLNTDYKKISPEVTLFLKKLRDNGRFRIKQANISAALAAEIDITFRNDTITYLLAGTDSQKCPMLHYYQAVEERQLQSKYSQIAGQLFLERRDEETCATLADIRYSIPYPLPQARYDYVTRSVTNIKTALSSDKLNLSQKHNLYTDYVVSLLMFATSHRPIRDPFCYNDLIDTDSGFVTISDKVSNENQRYRLSILPTLAIAQLKLYKEHLLGLAWLIRSKSVNHAILTAEINLLLEQNSKATIPLFFHINPGLTRTSSIRQSTIGKYTRDLWVFPPNFHRHILSTESEKLQIPTHFTKNQLGHSAGVDHHFGETSMLSPYDIRELILPRIDQSMEHAGWQAIPYRTSVISKNEPFIQNSASAVSPHLASKLGPEIRRENRQKNLEKNKQVVKQSIAQILKEEGNEQLTEDVIAKIITRISTKASLNGENPNPELRLFYRWLSKQKLRGKLKEKYKRQFFITHEPSPFSDKTLTNAQRQAQFKRNFEQYLSSKLDKNGKPEKPKYIVRIAEIIISAALFGKRADPVALESLGLSINTHCRQLNGLLFIDIWEKQQEPSDFKPPYTRWFPDEVSGLLLLGLYRAYPNSGICTQETVIQVLQRLTKQITGKLVSQKNLYLFWAEIAEAALSLSTPGYLHSAINRHIPATCLPTSALFRLTTSRRLIDPRTKTLSESHTQIVNWMYASTQEKVANQESLKQFEKAIQKAFSITEKPVKSFGRFRKQRKKELVRKLQNAMEDEGSFPVTPNLLVAWLIHISIYGTVRKLDPAFNTILKYRSLLQRPLLREAYDKNILEFDEDEFESLYTDVIESSSIKNNSNLGNVISQFHNFLVDNFGVVEIDSSSIWKNIDFIDPLKYQADANLIAHIEYEIILSSILSDDKLHKTQRDQYAALLIFGYRFGLRIGECFNLQLRDIQADDQLEEIYLLIRNNIFHEKKTPASKRKIPLVECLSLEEKNILWRIIEITTSTAAGDFQATIMSKPADPRLQSSRSDASLYLNYLIKKTTGDMGARFHHLRHGFLNRVLMYSNPDNFRNNPIFTSLTNYKTTSTFQSIHEKSLGRKTLKTLSIIAGHAHEKQSLTSYLHLSDYLMYENTRLREQRCDDRLIAYCTQRPTGTIRVMRSRLKPKSKSLASLYNSENFKRIPHVILDSEPHPKKIDSKNKNIYLPVTLSNIDRLLTINVNRKGKLVDGRTCQEYQLSKSTLSNIINSAKQIELESSYEGYQVNKIANGYECTPNNIFVGNDKFHRLLKDIQKTINDPQLVAHVGKAVNIWSRCYYHGSQKLYLENANSAIDYAKGMNKLYREKLEYHLDIPSSFPDITHQLQLFSESNSFRYRTVKKIPKAHSKPGMSRDKRFLLKIYTLPSIVVSHKQMDRLHFLVATYLRCENRNQP